MSDLIIHTSSLTDNFTIVPNALIRNRELKPQARLALIWLLSHQKTGWELNVRGVATQLGIGHDALITITKALQKHGYLVIKRHSNGLTEWFVSDDPEILKPHSENPNRAKKPHSEKPNTEKPNTEKPNTLRKPSIKKEKINKNIANSSNSEKIDFNDFQEVAKQNGCKTDHSEFVYFMEKQQLKGIGYKHKSKWLTLAKHWFNNPNNQSAKLTDNQTTLEKAIKELKKNHNLFNSLTKPNRDLLIDAVKNELITDKEITNHIIMPVNS